MDIALNANVEPSDQMALNMDRRYISFEPQTESSHVSRSTDEVLEPQENTYETRQGKCGQRC